jgi:hypothetical protein
MSLESSFNGRVCLEESLHDATSKRLDILIDSLERQGTLAQQLPVDFASNLRQFQVDMTTQQVVKTLQFPQIKGREFTIPEAHKTTFTWIFDCQTTNFSSWLRSYGGVYWIYGKAGSGKSTLMKFLLSHQKTDELLRGWAGQKQLVMASHFFWSQGTMEQRSLAGLFQTLLSQILVQCPQLISVLPKQRQDPFVMHQTPWSLPELSGCFSALCSASLINTRICLFVDGLDEYDGDHRELTEVFHALTQSKDVKICASSRPWVEFISAFGEFNWKLAVHKLTSHDILTYVSDNLKSHKSFKDLSLEHGAKAEELVMEITKKAQGVFLWVYFVVRSLVRGMGNKDTLQDLRMRLNELPGDLERYFSLMMGSIERIYYRRTAKVLRVLLHAETTVPVLTFYFLDEEEVNPDYAFSAVCIDHAKQPEELKRHQLIAQCRDLVHITSTLVGGPASFRHGVGFLHRTVADYLKTAGPEALLSERLGQHFDPRLSLCRSFLAQFKIILTGLDKRQGAHLLLQQLAAGIVHFAREMELVNRRSEKQIFDNLDAAVPKSLWASITGVRDCNSLLQLATRCGMSLYVRETALDERKQGEALCASLQTPISVSENKMHSNSYGAPSFKMTQELLEAGASPNYNLIFDQDTDASPTTPWREFMGALKYQVPQFPRQGSEVNHCRGDVLKSVPLQWYSVCHLFLSKGAKVRKKDWAVFNVKFSARQNEALRRLISQPDVEQPSTEPMLQRAEDKEPE